MALGFEFFGQRKEVQKFAEQCKRDFFEIQGINRAVGLCKRQNGTKSWTGYHCLVFYKDLRINLRSQRLEVLEVSVVSTVGLDLEVPKTDNVNSGASLPGFMGSGHCCPVGDRMVIPVTNGFVGIYEAISL